MDAVIIRGQKALVFCFWDVAFWISRSHLGNASQVTLADSGSGRSKRSLSLLKHNQQKEFSSFRDTSLVSRLRLLASEIALVEQT